MQKKQVCKGPKGCAEGAELTAQFKEGLEKGGALFRKETVDDLDAVVEFGMVHDLECAAAGAGLWIGSGVDKASDASVQKCPGTHGAGLQRDVYRAAGEAVVLQGDACGAEGDHLRVGGGVVVADDVILSACD